VLLTILDAKNYNGTHWALTLAFMACVAISALGAVAGVGWMRKRWSGVPYVRKSYRVKAWVVSIAIVFAILMIILQFICPGQWSKSAGQSARCNRYESTAAVFEWLVAVLFGVYVATYVIDLRSQNKNVVESWEGQEEMRASTSGRRLRGSGEVAPEWPPRGSTPELPPRRESAPEPPPRVFV